MFEQAPARLGKRLRKPASGCGSTRDDAAIDLRDAEPTEGGRSGKPEVPPAGAAIDPLAGQLQRPLPSADAEQALAEGDGGLVAGVRGQIAWCPSS